MKLGLQEGNNAGELTWQNWHLVLHGDAIDDRGTAVLQEVATRTTSMRSIRYRPDDLKVDIDTNVVLVDELADSLRACVGGRVLLEATTLGLAEIVLCCKALRDLGQSEIDIIYVEPKNYHRPQRSVLLRQRDFELSGEVPGYRAIPGSALLLSDRKPVRSVFFLGYEDARLRRAFEELQMVSPAKASVAIGVPAFKPGWEMDAMANNISVVREHNVRGGVHFCGAENPLAVVELLSEVYEGLEAGERLTLAPIGTKPHGIGVALFAATHNDVGIIYDHPRRTKGRSSEVGHWHLFTVEEFQVAP
ncbi:MAG: hypothetical protein C0483_07465 [Pirellula sp.]|nr:hypothetical protein [Pirellula sp.]